MTGERIAIVGLACRYPDAVSPDQLWHNVLGRRRAFRRLPDTRLSDAYRGDRADAELSYLTHAGVLRDWEFDRGRFGIPGPLFRAADLTHWLALETAADALADSGHPDAEGLNRDTVGVILGNSLGGEFTRAATLRFRWPFIAAAATTALRDTGAESELAGEVLIRLEELVKQPFPVPGDETLIGALANTIAGRICNHFDLHGTGYTVDGACSSSLLAVMSGCRALVDGECDYVLAGGVDMSLDPLELVGFSRLGALAREEMRVYDTDPTGFLPGEGCGVVALMRAEDADRAGIRSYAHIVGWASASDGAGSLSRPERRGQELAMRRAYRKAGFAPGAVQLVEGHGTGTEVGDRTELDALTAVRAGAPAAALGSIKANIGHTKAAAGVAGLIKAALATAHRVLPPTTGCVRPHELLRGSAPALRVLAEPEAWTSDVPRAAVSSMGFGGINTHVVLEGEPVAVPPVLPAQVRRLSARPGPAEIVVFGAVSPAALADRLRGLAGTAARLSSAELGDVAATAWREGTGGEPFRVALVAVRPEDLAAAAAAAAAATEDWDGRLLLDERAGFTLASGRPARVGLLFPGQAAPVRHTLPAWTARLATAAGLAAAPATLDEHRGRGPSGEPRAGSGTAPPENGGRSTGAETDTAVAQPAVVRQSLAGLAWLDALGTVAVAACGHSLGELTALHWAGAWSAAEVLDLARTRGRLMAEHGLPGTAMASIGCSAEDLGPLPSGAVIAGYNAPARVVVAGARGAVGTVVADAGAAGIDATWLPVSHGFHSPAMRPVEGPWRAALSEVPTTEPRRWVVSTVTGKELASTVDGLVDLLVDQLTLPVLFAAASTALAADCDLLVEVGPGTTLAGLVRANEIDVPVTSLDCGGDPRRHAFATAALAAAGAADLDPWFAGGVFRRLPLDAVPTFVTGPCENRAGWATAPGRPPERPPARAAAAPVAAAGSGAPLEVLTTHLVNTLELPESAITPDSSLLADLHLNSLQVVQLVSTVATTLGRKPPASPMSLVEATVGDAAAALSGLPAVTGEPDDDRVPGVRDWVRPFETVWIPFEPAGNGPEPDVVSTLPDDAGAAEIAALCRRFAADPPDRLLLVHNGHPAAAGLGRSLVVELPATTVVVADVAGPLPVAAAALSDGGRYLELKYGRQGTWSRAELRVRRPPDRRKPAASLRAGDVCLVTGGILGISAFLAAELAGPAGATLVLTGRTPADDPAVTAALARLRERVPAHYIACDVTDAGAVACLLTAARGHGELRALVHGAAVNEPRRLADVTAATLAETLRPKVTGLRTLLDQAGDGLRLVLGFGSIIGRAGLAGQAEYCVANDWLRVDLERWAAQHPSVRCHVLEWSVWAELGMGVRMDVLDTLRRTGVAAIAPERGAQALTELLADEDAPVSVLLTARFPGSPTLPAGPEPATPLRFAERSLVHVPGVEVVREADLSLGADPYLAEHRIDGTPVLPAVLALEALAQTAAPLRGRSLPVALADVELRVPVTADRSTGATIRTAALAVPEGVAVVLRERGDRFATDRVTAVVEPSAPRPDPATADRGVPAEPDHAWYDSGLFFHDGRFRRLAGYDRLSAFRVRAALVPAPDVSWFSEYHGQATVLGDPGAHDATLHVLLACVPHRKALPVGARRFTVWARPDGPLVVDAREISHGDGEYVFDADLLDQAGNVVARWERLRLHDVGARHWPEGLPPSLVGPWLSRIAIECGIDRPAELSSALVGADLEITAAEPGPTRISVTPATAAGQAPRVERADGHTVLTAVTSVRGAGPVTISFATRSRG
ncbi:SDR family NAD(P)-dependent oxidoreductase [Amycolatopsis sp. NPDC005003]